MSIFDIYSKRKKRTEQTEPDVYQYDKVPSTVRKQIEYIWDEAIGRYWAPRGSYMPLTPPSHNNEGWELIRHAVCRERGIETLAGIPNAKNDCVGSLLGEKNIDQWLDVVEFSFTYIERVLGRRDEYERERLSVSLSPDDAIKELNYRLREAAVGYQFSDGKIIRVDSEFVHAEVVLPALQLLQDERFAGAQVEFTSAHAHYRAAEYKDCVTDALNAFESTMKVICDVRGWEHKKGARASDLIKVLRNNGLLPDYLDASFDQLIATLTSGLPKVRNEEGGHGQGGTPRETPRYVAAYALHLAAAKIVLLVEAMNDCG